MTSRTVDTSGAATHGRRLLLFVVCSLLLANVVQWGLCRALHLGNPGSIKGDVAAFMHMRQWTDSWLPMMKSLDYFDANSTKPIYAAPLYDTLIYSLASELPLVALRRLGVGDAAMLRLLAVFSWLSVVGVAGVSLAMGRGLLRRRGADLSGADVLAVILACLGCYPLLKGYALGNAQTMLSFGFALMLYLWTSGREREAGVVAALLAFVKPQYVLLLVWMVVRKRWGAMWAFLICSVVLLTMSVAVFGWHNNLDYVGVLASLSHKAQSHYANQSMFGTLNRMIFNGENLGYTPHVYTPYVSWVYRTTVLTSLVLVCGVLLYPWRKLRGSTADIAAMGLASVAASPMAWEHHYGIVFGIFAWFWFAYGCWEAKRPWLWGLSFFLCDNFLAATNLLADRRGWNVLQSYMYFGALLLLVLLMRLARRAEGVETVAA
ncbi:glycosyltransferase family 87 protein [Tunturiibacter gelidiferens]|uniref:Glycosyltransferase family 87 protein n=1 Tax=Tunturiibacter gelidiferens TaxID=3069689 RepID=A0AAU7Z3P4_9BACT